MRQGEAREVSSHRDLVVWQRAMDLTMCLYALTATFPADERFRLTQQITRTGASVAANIAEGSARATRREYAHFLAIARGSLREVDTFVELAVRLGYIERARIRRTESLIAQVSKMLTATRKRLLSPSCNL